MKQAHPAAQFDVTRRLHKIGLQGSCVPCFVCHVCEWRTRHVDDDGCGVVALLPRAGREVQVQPLAGLRGVGRTGQGGARWGVGSGCWGMRRGGQVLADWGRARA